jgi:hypothetical protein
MGIGNRFRSPFPVPPTQYRIRLPGIRRLIAQCHFGAGKFYRGTDKLEQAHEHDAGATAMYRQMAMTNWLEKAKRESMALT